MLGFHSCVAVQASNCSIHRLILHRAYRVKKWAYYNDNDKQVCDWVRELIKRNLIAPGEVDERSIKDVKPDDVKDFAQCHWFCGIGGWSYALRIAGWSDDAAVWTGSCPCQPFSAAGKRRGTADPRHLWPEMRRLVAECRPTVVFGEQVASKDGRQWLAGVRADLEALGYAVGAADLCAAGVGAPHIRQRLWWVADMQSGRREQPEKFTKFTASEDGERTSHTRRSSKIPGRLGIANCGRRGSVPIDGLLDAELDTQSSGGVGGVGDADGLGEGSVGRVFRGARAECPRSPWDDWDAVYCRDGKLRRVEPGTFPLAARLPGRVAALRGYGNAINPWVAKEFLEAYLEAREVVV